MHNGRSLLRSCLNTQQARVKHSACGCCQCVTDRWRCNIHAAGDLSDILRIELKPSSAASEAPFLSFKDFDSGSALDSALALVEHLMDG